MKPAQASAKSGKRLSIRTILVASLVFNAFQVAIVMFMFSSHPESDNSSHHSPHVVLATMQKVKASTAQFDQEIPQAQHDKMEVATLSSDGENDEIDLENEPEEGLRANGDNGSTNSSTRTVQVAAQHMHEHEHDFHLDGSVDTKDNWEHMDGLPAWVTEYLTWHNEEIKKVTKDNWKHHRFLVMQCVREDPHCGGTSDRLKPLPLLLFLAHQHKRLFLIWWTRPCRLEEFLVPNAINWTVPDFLPLANGDFNGKQVAKTDGIQVWTAKKRVNIVRSRMQSYDGGQFLYENITDSTYNEIYHDLFRLLFDPSPAIAAILRREMGEAGIVPGEYAVAHYRAFYARANRHPETIANYAINAANCASNLRPGGPIYFASDSTFALSTVRDYGKQHSYKIVTIENHEPLHLDKAGNWSERHPSDFYSIFVDLYLMGMGRCLSWGQGGFGKFGLLVGYNASCNNRHTWNTHLLPCNWTSAGDSAAAVNER